MKYYKSIRFESIGAEFTIAVNISGRGAPTENTAAEIAMIYMDTDSEDGDLYKCIAVEEDSGRKVYRWKMLAGKEEVERLSKTKVSLPTNADGIPNYGTVGYYAVSDGKGGITWVASGNTGGGTGEIPDGSITPEKTTFMETEGIESGITNVYNAKDTQWGYWTSDGVYLRTVADTKYGFSGYMPILPNNDISISPRVANGLSKNVFYYDENKNFLGSVVAYDASGPIDPIVITDENARYIRFNIDGYFDTVVKTMLPVREKYVLDPDYLPADAMRYSQHVDISKEKWRGKKITVDGDSITDSLFKEWWSYLKEWFDLSEVQNCAGSGKTIIEDRGDGRTCLERVEQDYAQDTNAILMMGAGNSGTTQPGNIDDTFEDGTFYGKMNGLIDKLQELFPLIPIVLIATPPRMNQPNLFNQYEQLKTIAENKCIYFIDCFHGTLNPDNENCRAAYIPDGVHPNEMGNKIIAQTIYEEMKRIGIAFE